MEIDIRTLVIILGVTHLMQVLVFFHQFKVNKTYRGLGWWLMWSAAEVIGFGVMLLRNIPSFLAGALIIQNLMIVAGSVFLFLGVKKFFNSAVNLKLLFLVVSVFLAGLFYFLFIDNNIQIRTGIICTTVAVISFFTAYSLFINKTRCINVSANFNAVVFLVHGGILVYRALILFTGTPVENIFSPTLFNIIPYFDALIASLLWTFGFIIMLNQRLNAEISEAKEDLQLIFNTSPDAAIISGLEDGRIVNVNEGYTTISGYTREEMKGKSTPEINIWKNIDDRQKVVNLLKKQGFCENYEADFMLKNGVELTGLLSAKIINLQGVPHIISITRNITERKRAEEALKESERDKSELLEKLNESQNISNVGSWEWNFQTDHLWCSDECYRILGVKPQDFVPNLEANSRFIHPDDLELCCKSIEHSLQTGEPLDINVRLVPGDEQMKHCHGIGKILYDDSGQPVRFVGTIKDITARKLTENALIQSEEKYRNIFETTLEGIYQSTPEGRYISANPAFARMLGYSSPNELLTSISDIGKQIYVDPGQRLKIRRLLSDTGVVKNFETQLFRKDGSIIWVQINSKAIRDDKGELLLYQGGMIDITERKRAEKEITKLNETLEQRVLQRTSQLEESIKELEAFSYSVSHDLRAPLRHISGYVNLLTKQFNNSLQEKEQHYLDSIAGSANHMGELIDDLLQFSRSGRQEMVQTKLNMNDLFQEVLKTIKQDISGRTIEWIIVPLPYVLGDVSLLRLVWMNLLSNAVKFTRVKKKARIETGYREESNEYLFFVRDNGAGFDMQYADKLFGVFQRLHSSHEFEGTGIGLANVHRIILKHGGRTWAEAKVDKGATFYFTLPK
ncbi:MAG: PAS domain S-box protein [Bacteroidetes bacterium]|nr:PAS domain S-box protein [Bacteroidota bacterium]